MRPVPAPALLRALRLLLPLAACALAYPAWSNSDDLVHLYTSSARKSLHLRIHPDGRVDGSPDPTVDSALVIRTLLPGYVMISGPKSGLYLCMDSSGNLFGSRSFSNEDCTFKHTMLENGYDAYHSPRHNFLVSLGRVKKALVPGRNLPSFSQFLTRRNEIPLVQFDTPRPQQEEPRNANAEPCGGGLLTTGKLPEENLDEEALDPCFDYSKERDPNGATLDGTFPSPQWS
ncbi:fibroblast growth factor 23-like [Protobothrops mucrosquamatus]|uniref:fibroblast growth factor 23-like n=1 Tax=Protobothrops mucrosquamatus TaxID=103944 RepID=UPI0007758363|nr:fibroblast growth factor 23-like [Protobothrops mucrosquamatus]